MSEEEFTQYLIFIRQQIEALYEYIVLVPTNQQQLLASAMEEIATSLDNLQLFQEEMQANLETMEVIQEDLLEQNEYLAKQHQRYHDLFEFAPNAYLLTNAQGIILEANRAAGALFNVLPNFLVSKPLVNYVHEIERSVFRSKLNKLSSACSSLQEWEITMCPRGSQPFNAVLMVAPDRDSSGLLVSLQIAIWDVTEYKNLNQQQPAIVTERLVPEAEVVSLPHSLDGLQVLFVDDEADIREFITAVLEQHGIYVTAVASVAQALELLEQYSQEEPPKGRTRPDVILSDIRMPDEDGYALIKKVRALETEKGWHIPAAALTAYLAEDRAKALKAGFQSHLHKLAEPMELIAMIAQLAGRA
ncbi:MULTISPECIES: response regulator [Nostocales]|uniref:PAS/PAC sensor protein n=3 Tax=Nostocales TaxID=1161 RepID=A0A0C1RD80_9CYAN|nr:response regulator [Tolypothrix bouteillei]KAF3884235.1 response regulator [Tolypothrix bouteillei VB521301]